jgi:alpha-L-fucosidase 2
MDNQILREFFAACIEMQKIIGTDEAYGKNLSDMIEKLPKDQIGSKGQLLEWDQEYPELTPGMGHVSHLFAAFPGSSINWRDTPELLKAVDKSLELRIANGAGKAGWPLAWYICLYARSLDGKKTDELIKGMLSNSATRSFLNARRVFQIDGNLGAAAGIAESLLQSHVGIHFLPALPVSWKSGSVKGMVVRGGHTVDMKWDGGKLTEAVLTASGDKDVEIVGDTLAVTCGGNSVETKQTKTGFVFTAARGKQYTLVAR